MSQRTQWIVLAVLICILAVVGVTSLSHKGSSAGPALPASKAASAAGAAQAAMKPEGEALNAAQLAPLQEWFSAKDNPSAMSQATANSFGQRPKSTATTSGAEAGPTIPSVPGAAVAVREAEPPPALQGTLGVKGVAMALFEDEAYRSGDRIPDTAYTVTAVTAQSASVKGADGKVITLKLSE